MSIPHNRRDWIWHVLLQSLQVTFRRLRHASRTEFSMNETTLSKQPSDRKNGRLYLMLGMVATVLGPVIFAVQFQNHILTSPWYVPALATLGVVLMIFALVQRRTVWRLMACGLTAFFAVLAWLMLMGMSAPPYTGSVEVGRAFPHFETNLADGTGFSQTNLNGGQNTVLVFFRGRW